MTSLKAGVGRSVITPRVGAELRGYGNRVSGSTGIHDDIHARALVLDDGQTAIALCSIEMCWLLSRAVAEIRDAVAKRCALQPQNIFVFTTHTHSGPASPTAENAGDWARPLAEIVADAIVQAYESRVDAKFAAGFGLLFGYSLNRRWLNRPIDPSVGVIRVDRADGTPLAVLGNYACHAVVMGYDNLLISGDWPGYASRLIEADLGHGSVALFGQGGAADVNPLTETVRQQLAAGHPVTGIGNLTTFYGEHGKPDQPNAYNIGDRGGGKFLECETVARAYQAEVMRVYRSLTPKADAPLWVESVTVDGRAGADEPPPVGLTKDQLTLLPEYHPDAMEITLVGIGSVIIEGQPGEVFGENAVEFRKTCQQMGYAYPLFVSYANGSYAYLPPANAFLEGGYEVQWALNVGLSRHLQDWIASAIQPVLERHKP